VTSVDLQQDFGSIFLKEPEIKKLWELQIMDRLSEDEGDDIDWDIVEVISPVTSKISRPAVLSRRVGQLLVCMSEWRRNKTCWLKLVLILF
jgi:hypothetical protein